MRKTNPGDCLTGAANKTGICHMALPRRDARNAHTEQTSAPSVICRFPPLLPVKEHEESAAFANANVEETAQLVADAGIIEKAPVAAKAIPYCNITYIDGADMQTKVSGYLSVLFDLDPTSIGGQLPDEGFYYIHE